MTCKRWLTGAGLLALLLLALPGGLRSDENKDEEKVTCRIIYVPTPQVVVEKMLDLARVTDRDVVYDLGCGDGRVVCSAALQHGAHGVGVDIDPVRIKDCKATLQQFNDKAREVCKKLDSGKMVVVGQGGNRAVVRLPRFEVWLTDARKGESKSVAKLPALEPVDLNEMVEFRQGDALKVKDLEKASVVMLYMLPEFMAKLEPIVKKKLKVGSRIVAHDYPFPDWKPDQTIEFRGPDREHTLYVWEVKANGQR